MTKVEWTTKSHLMCSKRRWPTDANENETAVYICFLSDYGKVFISKTNTSFK